MAEELILLSAYLLTFYIIYFISFGGQVKSQIRMKIVG